MVKATDFRNLDDFPSLHPLGFTWLRAVHVQRQMRAPVLVVAEVAPQHTPQGTPLANLAALTEAAEEYGLPRRGQSRTSAVMTHDSAPGEAVACAPS